MTNDLDILWSEFKTHCVEVISGSDSAIKTYLDTCLPVSIKDGALVLDVPTPFAKEQIKSRFLNKMKDLLLETGFGTSIEIEVSQEIKEDVGAAGRAVAAAVPAKFSLSRATGWPSVYHLARPRADTIMPSVAMKGGILV